MSTLKTTEYAVYTIKPSADGQLSWQLKHTGKDKAHAIARAQVLHRSREYDRVEVKRKRCDNDNVCSVEENYRVYTRKELQSIDRREIIASIILGLILLSAFAFVL